MADEVNTAGTQQQNADPAETGEQAAKSFTQEQVNQIVQDRLSREKAKGTAELEQKQHDLEAREARLTARELLTQNHLPAELADVLDCSAPDKLEDKISQLQTFIQQHDADMRKNTKFKGFVPAQGSSRIPNIDPIASAFQR